MGSWSKGQEGDLQNLEIGTKGRKTNNMELLKNFIREEEGQDLVEYALLLVLLVLAAVAALSTLATSINQTFSRASSQLNAGS